MPDYENYFGGTDRAYSIKSVTAEANDLEENLTYRALMPLATSRTSGNPFSVLSSSVPLCE